MVHGASPESITRYAQPTQAELEEMFGDPPAREIHATCAHARVCRMWNDIRDESDEAAAALLECASCGHWDDWA